MAALQPLVEDYNGPDKKRISEMHDELVTYAKKHDEFITYRNNKPIEDRIDYREMPNDKKVEYIDGLKNRIFDMLVFFSEQTPVSKPALQFVI